MKICSKEMAAIVYGAGSPSGFTSSFASPAPQVSSTVSYAGPSVSSTGGAAAGTVIGNTINGDGSFQNGVATAVGGFVAHMTEAVTLAVTRNPVFSIFAGTATGTVATNYVNSLDPSAGPPTNVDAMGNVQGPEGTRGGGDSPRGDSSGGVATGGNNGDASGGGDRGTRGGW